MAKGFTVALIGPDGTGKSTITKKLMDSLPIPAKHIYMGLNIDSSNYALPTTRFWHTIKRVLGKPSNMGGPPDPSIIRPLSRHPVKRSGSEIKSGLRILNLIAEEWFRQCMAWYFQLHGYVVLFDRHFYFDYYMHHISNEANERTISDRLHGLLLKHLYPKPSLVIYLDAPAEILFFRKPEGSVELLAQRRNEYQQMSGLAENFVTVDTTQPVEKVVEEVCTFIMDFRIQNNPSPASFSKS